MPAYPILQNTQVTGQPDDYQLGGYRGYRDPNYIPAVQPAYEEIVPGFSQGARVYQDYSPLWNELLPQMDYHQFVHNNPDDQLDGEFVGMQASFADRDFTGMLLAQQMEEEHIEHDDKTFPVRQRQSLEQMIQEYIQGQLLDRKHANAIKAEAARLRANGASELEIRQFIQELTAKQMFMGNSYEYGVQQDAILQYFGIDPNAEPADPDAPAAPADAPPAAEPPAPLMQIADAPVIQPRLAPLVQGADDPVRSLIPGSRPDDPDDLRLQYLTAGIAPRVQRAQARASVQTAQETLLDAIANASAARAGGSAASTVPAAPAPQVRPASILPPAGDAVSTDLKDARTATTVPMEDRPEREQPPRGLDKPPPSYELAGTKGQQVTLSDGTKTYMNSTKYRTQIEAGAYTLGWKKGTKKGRASTSGP